MTTTTTAFESSDPIVENGMENKSAKRNPVGICKLFPCQIYPIHSAHIRCQCGELSVAIDKIDKFGQFNGLLRLNLQLHFTVLSSLNKQLIKLKIAASIISFNVQVDFQHTQTTLVPLSRSSQQRFRYQIHRSISTDMIADSKGQK